MINIKFKTLAKAVGGKLTNDSFAENKFKGVSIDSRTIEKDMLFVAITGENNDGHKYIDDAISKGCAGLIVSDRYDVSSDLASKCPIVVVGDTHQALIDLAIAYRKHVGATYIGITGSNGKTTTKDMTYAMINNREKKTYRSTENLNNLFGLPLSILGMPDDTRYGVFELGISVTGEMARLSRILCPDLAVITNIGPTHLESLGTIENVAKEKFSMIDNSSPDYTAVINIDDKYIANEAFKKDRPFLTYGLSDDADIQAEKIGIDENGFPKYKLKTSEFSIPIFGDYQIYNVLAGASVCRELGFFPTQEELNNLEYPQSPHRGQFVNVNDITIIDDCYNANPVSMKAGIESFDRYVKDAGDKYKRSIVILGDMLELGNDEIEYHREIGMALAKTKIDLILTVGGLAEYIGTSAKENGFNQANIVHFADAISAGEYISGNTLRGDVAYLKASRGTALEKIIELLEKTIREKG